MKKTLVLLMKNLNTSAIDEKNTSAIDEKFRDFLLATAFLNVHGQLEAYGNALKMADEHIDKVQMWAVINNEVTVHRRELYEAEQPAIEEYNEVSTIIDTFNCHHPLDEIGKPAAIADLHYPQTGTYWWNCFGTKYHNGGCMIVYNTPYAARDDHYVQCGSSNDPLNLYCIGGCGDRFYSCNDRHKETHGVLYCTQNITYYTYDRLSGNWMWISLGVCGETYRRCTAMRGIHKYNHVWTYNSEEYGGYYISSYSPQSPSNHGSGATTPPAVSIYGPNGVGFRSNAFDVSPRCDTCADNSSNCPDADTQH